MAAKIITTQARFAAFAMAFIATAASAGLEITEYTEDFTPGGNPAFALGFPVPVAVASQLPVTGFRTYDSLHARYQDLMLTNDYIQGQIVGQTFNGRDIWAYQLSDEDTVNMYGVPEPAMLVNGGLHVREWQTPEVLAGIFELFAENSDDHYIHQYLMENTNIILVPVGNPDGLLQTQRYPSTVIVGGDSVSSWPRDGRMRRKNMRGVDENINTLGDHLLGVDLNRNNAPFWRANVSGTLPTINSSDNVTSLVHHGSGPFSEPESQAREVAADLGPTDKLRVYMDVHSFGQFFPWYQSNNAPLNNFTYDLMIKLREHHVQFPAGKWYFIPGISPGTFGAGGGATDESYMERYQIPAWTPELEPNNGGTDYGGFGAEHDGFILPMSEVPRVRTEMAETMWLAFYEMAGPPAVKEFQILDKATGAVLYDAEWDTTSNTRRELHEYNLQPLTFNREYTLWVAFDKPMLWRDDQGELTGLPGQNNSGDLDLDVSVSGIPLPAQLIALDGAMEPGGSPRGYYQYRDDALWADFTLDPIPLNGTQTADVALLAFDMMGAASDGDPSTIVDWQDGGWVNYEDNAPAKGTSGGIDDNYGFDVTAAVVPLPFLVEPGTSRSWYDVSHDGEGFLIEIVSGDSAVVYWFTYDGNGNQVWYFGVGRIVGNRIIIDDLLTSAGGKFGADFDPADVVFSSAGTATFLFESCTSGFMKYNVSGQVGRMVIEPASSIAGLDCGAIGPPAKGLVGGISGSYYDILHDGEGFLVEILSDVLALVYWFSYDADGNQRWFFAVGTISGDTITIDEFLTTSGGIFGPDFDPDTVVRSVWGSATFRLNCDGGDMDYVATEPGFGSGDQDLSRITAIAGLPCL
jgi:hypothetical protein